MNEQAAISNQSIDDNNHQQQQQDLLNEDESIIFNHNNQHSHHNQQSEEGIYLNFIPPPPRPLFFEDILQNNDLTSCNLCHWALQDKPKSSFEGSREFVGELGWVLTLIIVSISSALIGAVIMVIIIHCKKLQTYPSIIIPSEIELGANSSLELGTRTKEVSTISSLSPADSGNDGAIRGGEWSWLSSSKRNPNDSSSSAVENHYTVETASDHYNVEQIILYDELDKGNNSHHHHQNNTKNNKIIPAYQNTAYTSGSPPPTFNNSAPSSAYYSDLSVGSFGTDNAATPERAYEIVQVPSSASAAPATCHQNNKEFIKLKTTINNNKNSNIIPDYV